MKKILFAVVASVAMAGAVGCTKQASAESYAVSGVVTDVQPQYSNVANRIPQQSCSIVDVPIYSNGNNNSSVFGLDLEGAIIGGVIGNNVGDIKNGGAAGAIIGGLIGSDRKKNNSIVGYRQEQRCNTTYTTEYQQQYNGSIITVDVNGMKVSGRTNRQVNVGDTVSVQMDLRLR